MWESLSTENEVLNLTDYCKRCANKDAPVQRLLNAASAEYSDYRPHHVHLTLNFEDSVATDEVVYQYLILLLLLRNLCK
jgi:hypothetical protein